MAKVKVSSKYHIIIPPELRKKLKIKPGDQFEIFPFDGVLEMVRIPKVGELRGFVKGIDTSVPRDKDRV